MHRIAASSTRATSSSDEYHINMPPSQLKPPPRKKPIDEISLLPIQDPILFPSKRDITLLKPTFSEKWVHIVPLIIIFCTFMLWWYSHPVNVVVKKDRIIAINPIDVQTPLNITEWKQTAFSSFAKWEMQLEDQLFGNILP